MKNWRPATITGIMLIILLLTISLLTSCASQTPVATSAKPTTSAPITSAQPAPTVKFPQFIRIATTTVGTPGHSTGIVIARLIDKYIPGTSGQVTPAVNPFEDVRMLSNGETDIAYGSAGAMDKGLKGIDPYKTPVSYRLLFSQSPAALMVMATVDSGIKSFADMKGKTGVFEKIGSFFANHTIDCYLQAYGVKLSDMKVLKGTSHDDMIRPLLDGTADATMIPGPQPQAKATELATQRKCVFIGLDKDKVEGVVAANKALGEVVSPTSVAPNTYPNQPQEMLYVGEYNGYGVAANFDENLVYAIMKAVWDHETEFAELQPGTLKACTKENALLNFTAPYHSGAIKYLKERGWWTAEHDAKQAQVLKTYGASK